MVQLVQLVQLPKLIQVLMLQSPSYSARSLLQFMVCGSEPHRSGSDEHAEWRSHNAMQTTCMVLTAPGRSGVFFGGSLWELQLVTGKSPFVIGRSS